MILFCPPSSFSLLPPLPPLVQTQYSRPPLQATTATRCPDHRRPLAEYKHSTADRPYRRRRPAPTATTHAVIDGYCVFLARRLLLLMLIRRLSAVLRPVSAASPLVLLSPMLLRSVAADEVLVLLTRPRLSHQPHTPSTIIFTLLHNLSCSGHL